MEISLIIFDWDGTLADSAGKIVSAMRQAFSNSELPLPAEGAVRHVIGLSLTDAITHLAPDSTTSVRVDVENEYRRVYALQESATQLFTGSREVLEHCRSAGVDLAIATGKSANGLKQALEQTESSHYFSSVRTADDCASKPAPQMIEEILLETGREKMNAIMVGDTTFDLEMAQNAGLPSVAACYGAHDRSLLAKFSPVLFLERIEELIEHI